MISGQARDAASRNRSRSTIARSISPDATTFPRAVGRPHGEGEAVADSGGWWLGGDLDAGTDRCRAAVLDSDSGPDGRLTRTDERCSAGDGGRLHPGNQPWGRQHGNVTAAQRGRGIGLDYLVAHANTVRRARLGGSDAGCCTMT